MADQLIIRLDPETKDKLNSLAKSEGKSTSQVLRELIDQYIREHDLAGYIDDLWERTGRKLKAGGFTPHSVEKVIREARGATE